MFRIFLVAALIASGMALAKRDHAFEKAGVVSYCRVVATPAGQDGEWRACSEGFLTGYPDLKLDSCERIGRQGKDDIWQCPVPVVTSRTPTP